MDGMSGGSVLSPPRREIPGGERSLLRPALFLAGHLVLQCKRADCGTASPVIAALGGLGGQNANRQSEHERGGGNDYASGHHGSPLGLGPCCLHSSLFTRCL
jgi:hypothetical protein